MLRHDSGCRCGGATALTAAFLPWLELLKPGMLIPLGRLGVVPASATDTPATQYGLSKKSPHQGHRERYTGFVPYSTADRPSGSYSCGPERHLIFVARGMPRVSWAGWRRQRRGRKQRG